MLETDIYIRIFMDIIFWPFLSTDPCLWLSQKEQTAYCKSYDPCNENEVRLGL